MTKKVIAYGALCLSTFMSVAFATAERALNEPINAECPIGKEPVVPSAGTTQHDGKTIGFCCPGCYKLFAAWDDARKDAFLAKHDRAVQPESTTLPTGEQLTADAAIQTPYPLMNCPVSGAELGSMGEPVSRVYDEREVRFCCEACVDSFEKDLSSSIEELDRLVIRDQKRYYPLETCVVTGEPLAEDGEDNAIEVVSNNRLVRLCCEGCERPFQSEPGVFLKKVDQAAADAQRADYPLEVCVVSGGKLGSMGEPTEMIVGGRLLRFCCASCESKVLDDPSPYLRKIDSQWQLHDRFILTLDGVEDGA